MKDSLYLCMHLGLGDAIICNGLVRVLSGRHSKIVLPAKEHNVATVKWMFSDLPNVTVLPVEGDEDMVGYVGSDSLKLGMWNPRGLRKRWSESFYEDAGVPFEHRWSSFRLPGFAIGSPALRAHCVFLHEDRKRDFVIDRRRIHLNGAGTYEPAANLPFETHLAPMQMCEQIHVIDSCFLCLADSLQWPQSVRLVLHLYANNQHQSKSFGPPTLRHKWEVLE